MAEKLMGINAEGMSDLELSKALKSYIGNVDTTAINKVIKEKENRALEVIDYAQKVLPAPQIPYNSGSLMMARVYDQLGEKEKRDVIISEMEHNSLQYLDWIANMDEKRQKMASNDFSHHLSIYSEILQMKYDVEEIPQEEQFRYSSYITIYNRLKK
jgi:hypothetical protein